MIGLILAIIAVVAIIYGVITLLAGGLLVGLVLVAVGLIILGYGGHSGTYRRL